MTLIARRRSPYVHRCPCPDLLAQIRIALRGSGDTLVKAFEQAELGRVLLRNMAKAYLKPVSLQGAGMVGKEDIGI